MKADGLGLWGFKMFNLVCFYVDPFTSLLQFLASILGELNAPTQIRLLHCATSSCFPSPLLELNKIEKAIEQ
jgi:hypothetical protein